jgi:hypothetical protein
LKEEKYLTLGVKYSFESDFGLLSQNGLLGQSFVSALTLMTLEYNIKILKNMNYKDAKNFINL